MIGPGESPLTECHSPAWCAVPDITSDHDLDDPAGKPTLTQLSPHFLHPYLPYYYLLVGVEQVVLFGLSFIVGLLAARHLRDSRAKAATVIFLPFLLSVLGAHSLASVGWWSWLAAAPLVALAVGGLFMYWRRIWSPARGRPQLGAQANAKAAPSPVGKSAAKPHGFLRGGEKR